MTKLVITSDTRINGKPINRGDVIDLDEKTTEGRDTIGHLHAAGRVCVHGSEGHDLLKEEIAAEVAAEEAAAKKAAKKTTAPANA